MFYLIKFKKKRFMGKDLLKIYKINKPFFLKFKRFMEKDILKGYRIHKPFFLKSKRLDSFKFQFDLISSYFMLR